LERVSLLPLPLPVKEAAEKEDAEREESLKKEGKQQQ